MKIILLWFLNWWWMLILHLSIGMIHPIYHTIKDGIYYKGFALYIFIQPKWNQHYKVSIFFCTIPVVVFLRFLCKSLNMLAISAVCGMMQGCYLCLIHLGAAPDSTHLDCFTVSLNTPNSRQIACRLDCARDCKWSHKNDGNFLQSYQPTMHCSLPMMQWACRYAQSIFRPAYHTEMPSANQMFCLIPYSHQARTV